MGEHLKRLKELRLNRGLSQKEIADYLGITVASYSLYERGNREPNISILKRIADFYTVSVDYLMGLHDKEESLCDLTTFQDEIDDYTQEIGEFLYYNPNHD